MAALEIRSLHDPASTVRVAVVNTTGGRLEVQVGRPGNPVLDVTQHATWRAAAESAVAEIVVVARRLLELTDE